MIIKEDLIKQIQTFMENEARSCSMDFGCVTPLYIYRMWGGQVPYEDIDNGLRVLRNKSLLCG
jgi:hypothetical protein